MQEHSTTAHEGTWGFRWALPEKRVVLSFWVQQRGREGRPFARVSPPSRLQPAFTCQTLCLALDVDDLIPSFTTNQGLGARISIICWRTLKHRQAWSHAPISLLGRWPGGPAVLPTVPMAATACRPPSWRSVEGSAETERMVLRRNRSPEPSCARGQSYLRFWGYENP